MVIVKGDFPEKADSTFFDRKRRWRAVNLDSDMKKDLLIHRYNKEKQKCMEKEYFEQCIHWIIYYTKSYWFIKKIN